MVALGAGQVENGADRTHNMLAGRLILGPHKIGPRDPERHNPCIIHLNNSINNQSPDDILTTFSLWQNLGKKDSVGYHSSNEMFR